MPRALKGGRKAAATNRKRHGQDFYVRIGALGGKASSTGGFYNDRDRARKMGAIGGSRGNRKKKRRPSYTELQQVYARLGTLAATARHFGVHYSTIKRKLQQYRGQHESQAKQVTTDTDSVRR